MPKRKDIRKILLIGSGPIVIGQACEFDYSGTQACKALREEGYQVVLINSNPATIMTDPEMADRTYIEPITPEIVEKIIARERPEALLPTLGGQTGLNIAVTLAETGVLDKYGVELIGAKLEAIKKAEDRNLFKKAMQAINLEIPESGYASSEKEARQILEEVGFPNIIRPSFTLGGTGGNIAYNIEEFSAYVEWGLNTSPVGQILIEESVIGWKEYELEVMRDLKDNVVIICSIENFDPMGIHTGDSITVAPAQTLTDKEYQLMRDAAIAIIREIGVETGGSNIQFAVNPKNGQMVVIEMNPRVSRSSALASKATGFPIAKIAAKLAVGYTLDEIPNDITRETPASFEPTIDYCVVKFPRFAFEKFPQADQTLTTQMKSVGEVMAIGRTFKEALQKAIRSLEIDRYGLEEMNRSHREAKDKIPRFPFAEPALRPVQGRRARDDIEEIIQEKLKLPTWERVWDIAQALRLGWTVEEIYELTRIDPWFLSNIQEIVALEEELKTAGASSGPLLRKAKEYGFSDRGLAQIWNTSEARVRRLRKEGGIRVTFKRVDTCAAEFEAYTPYLYSTYERECEAQPTRQKKIVILGSGPNRIGQGIEFDYCCVHAAYALKEIGYESIMVNCNPETVSTDYDTSDRLYFEPLTLEDVLNIVEVEEPDGVIVQFGGQTPLKLAVPLEKAGVKIIGTSPDSIDRAEDRERFRQLLNKLGLQQPVSGTALSFQEAKKITQQIGYPVLVRPSYVLGGRAMEVVYDESSLEEYITKAMTASPEHPVLIDKFLEDAIEIDVDAIADGHDVVIGGIMEHIEEAGIHSGDSSCSLPPYSLAPSLIETIKEHTYRLAKELQVVGLINIQLAIQGDSIYILEVNPRASRTIPFVSKAIGVPLAKLATKVMVGKSLSELGFTQERIVRHMAVKEAVFPFIKFPGVDSILGPEMKSTGEVMGIDSAFGKAFAKSQLSTDGGLPRKGKVFISVRDKDKPAVLKIARELVQLGFQLLATRGTGEYLRGAGLAVESVLKYKEGRPHIVDHIKNGEVALVINTPEGKASQHDSYYIRRNALVYNLPYYTTIAGAWAATQGIKAILEGQLEVLSLQEYHLASLTTNEK
ncbi:MAG: carbamoyl phosphate synthase large subunit [Nitrospinae bacterium RIFCSPLOWO2_12_FULL_45_22]|nr:MAG: carbamoyl phosphate synthase large subunit [Nitrospinae bacterium RIFCSPLOWO2_12_FULL_45_22]